MDKWHWTKLTYEMKYETIQLLNLAGWIKISTLCFCYILLYHKQYEPRICVQSWSPHLKAFVHDIQRAADQPTESQSRFRVTPQSRDQYQ